MSALSDYLEGALLSHLLRNTAYTPAATLYLALFTADPGESGIVGEVSGGSYARAAVTNNNVNFPQCAASGTPTKANATAITFPTASAAWGTITHWAIYDVASLASGTNMLAHGALSASRYVASGDTPKVAVGALSMTISNATSGGLTDFAKRKLLDHVFGGPTYTPAGTVYLALGTSSSTDSISEWTESTYTRQASAFDAPSGGATINADEETFTTNVSDGTETLSVFGAFDDSTSGNLLIYGPVSTSRTVNNGDTAKFPDGSFSVTFQ